MTDHKTILMGVVGSHAYGLNTPESDTDLRGCFVYDTQKVLSLRSYEETLDSNEPDICQHELSKFIKLAAQNNPNILEMFYLEEYETLTEEGQMLLHIRDAFLSQRVRATYGGYAMAQVKRLKTRTEAGDASFKSKLRKRYSKHARHTFRLLDQGQQILETGTLTVKVANRDELFAIGNLPADELIAKFEERFESFNACSSDLPEIPDLDLIDNVLLSIREMNWSKNEFDRYPYCIRS